jgi:hypothetical protein
MENSAAYSGDSSMDPIHSLFQRSETMDGTLRMQQSWSFSTKSPSTSLAKQTEIGNENMVINFLETSFLAPAPSVWANQRFDLICQTNLSYHI